MRSISKVWSEKKKYLCVGLDPQLEKIPQIIRETQEPIFEFCKEIVDATAEFVCAFKPQIAYFSAYAAEESLEKTIKYIHQKYPHIPVILDAKRGDIGATAQMYAKEVFERYEADAVTINPYMGEDTIKPFSDYKDKGTFLLCRTSNPGASDLQNLEINEKKLFIKVAELATEKYNQNQNIGLVMGATEPMELGKVRAVNTEMPFLVPGIGAQGGNISDCVKFGKDSQGHGLIFNSSRAILYSSLESDFAQKAAEQAKATHTEIQKIMNA